MNNRGFAITTILFGIMILFCLLLVSLLGILSTYKNNLEKLIDSGNGARDIVTIKLTDNYCYTIQELKDSNKGRGLYCITENETTGLRYVSNAELG